VVYATALEETFKVLDIFQIDCPSCLKVMTWSSIFCISPLPCHNKTDWLKCIKKKFHKLTFTRHTYSLKCIPGDYLMKLGERMPRVCKAVIKVNGGYFEESQI
jgi:hypothetical protein